MAVGLVTETAEELGGAVAVADAALAVSASAGGLSSAPDWLPTTSATNATAGTATATPATAAARRPLMMANGASAKRRNRRGSPLYSRQNSAASSRHSTPR